MLSLSFGVCDEWKAEAGAEIAKPQVGPGARRFAKTFAVWLNTPMSATLFLAKTLQSPADLPTRLCFELGPPFQVAF